MPHLLAVIVPQGGIKMMREQGILRFSVVDRSISIADI
jgi:hypothetical protein